MDLENPIGSVPLLAWVARTRRTHTGMTASWRRFASKFRAATAAVARTNQVPVRLSASAYRGQFRCQAAASRETVFLS